MGESNDTVPSLRVMEEILRLNDKYSKGASPMTHTTLRKLLAKATPGPWEWSENGNILGHMPNGYDETREVGAVYSERDDDLAPINAQLILAMHEALPALLDAAEERDALAAELATVKAMLEEAEVCTVSHFEDIDPDDRVVYSFGQVLAGADMIGKRVALVELPAPPVAGGGEG